MKIIENVKNRVMQGEYITKEDAIMLYKQPLGELCDGANDIRKYFCGEQFDICTIINGKSGKCSENCKFCAQSSNYNSSIEEYPLVSISKMVEEAKYNYHKGALRYSIVTSGRSLPDAQVDRVCEAVRRICKEVGISVCVSLGLLNQEQYKRLKDAGVSRIHNNLETSRNNFPKVCTTHTFDEKIKAIRSAQSVGLTVCSGGIMGICETVSDRIDMAFTLRELGIKSIPINMLNPILGTPFGQNKKLSNDEMRRIIAVYRFILPRAFIRLAGGRGLLEDRGKSCFLSGANAAISGDMLTTTGISISTDLELIRELGYKEIKCNE